MTPRTNSNKVIFIFFIYIHHYEVVHLAQLFPFLFRFQPIRAGQFSTRRNANSRDLGQENKFQLYENSTDEASVKKCT